MNEIIEKIFSIKNQDIYKVLTILGVRMKFLSAKNIFCQLTLQNEILKQNFQNNFKSLQVLLDEINKDLTNKSKNVLEIQNRLNMIDKSLFEHSDDLKIKNKNITEIRDELSLVNQSLIKHSDADNTIVAFGAFVNKSFYKQNTILAGTPAKIIKENVDWVRENTHLLQEKRIKEALAKKG